MKKLIFIPVFILLFSAFAMATHNRAGEITYEQIGEFTYRVTVTTYTAYGPPPGPYADRPELEVFWGDGTSDILPRHEETYLPNWFKKNVYIGEHTYPGPGTYEIVMEDPNRNDGVDNIPGSVHVKFTIKTTLLINPQIGNNSAPVLLNPPYDKAAVGVPFIHNPTAFDPDGDSLSYKLSVCLADNGEPIENYTLPPSSNTPIYVDELNGDLVWDAPVEVGTYNVAMEIQEWRNGIKIGQIIRDMQIDVVETDRNPPEISPLRDWCVEAGDTVSFDVSATDADTSDLLSLSAWGGPFELENSPAEFPPVSGNQAVSSSFFWATNCSHVRKRPYHILFKAEDRDPTVSDNDPDLINLVDNENVDITVISPAPENLTADANNNSIFLTWSPCVCPQATSYKIYRKNHYYGFDPDSCETGVPAYTGYKLIATLENYDDTTYNDQQGLVHGYEYCYMVVAYFADGAESYASAEACTPLVRGIPVITHVSIRNTDTENGSLYLSWAKPIDLDPVLTPPPYKYNIWRAPQLDEGFTKITELYDINDTIFIDTMLNTRQNHYMYKIGFYNDAENDGEWEPVGGASRASSVFLDIEPQDNALRLNFVKNVPWENYEYEIYLQDAKGETLIGTSDTSFFEHTGLQNGQKYCYRVKAFGEYSTDDITKPLINFSQINCAEPIDTTPPCPPALHVESFCDSLQNQLNWTNPNDYCADDVVGYKLYYSPTTDGEQTEIASFNSPDMQQYTHHLTETMAGCYTITAIDSFDNESSRTARVCVDDCIFYELPNVFTPDNDGINDIYHPGPYMFVEKVEMKIFNRWGKLVYQTHNPDINWRGKYLDTDSDVPEGIYYYICDVYEKRLTGLEIRNMVGFIHLYRNEKPQQP